MMTVKRLWFYLPCIFALFACAVPNENPVPTVSNFPLDKVQIFSTDDVIKRVAVSDTWMVVYISGSARAIDIKSRETLWKINITINADDPLGFVIVDNVLVATSENQVLLIDKQGHKKKLILESPNDDFRNIIRVASVYPDHIYINRFPDWELEAYGVSQRTKLWTMDVGRGATDVFQDGTRDIAYITTRYGTFFAVDIPTGKTLWKHNGSTLSTTFENDIIYAVEPGSNSQKIWLSAFNVESQTEIWRNEFKFSRFVYTMTVINDQVIISGDEGLLAVKKSDGLIAWQSPAGESFATKPVEYDGIIYAKATSHTIYAISPQNGDIIAYVSLENNKSTQPMYEVVSGIYKVNDGIVFNTRYAVLLYR